MKRIITGLILLAVIFAATNVMVMASESPLEVYEKMHKAIKSQDFDEMLKYASKNAKERIMQTPEEDRPKAMAILAMMTPNEYKVLETKINGDEATLILEASISLFGSESELSKGTVKMVKEEGQWKLDGEDWEAKGDKEK